MNWIVQIIVHFPRLSHCPFFSAERARRRNSYLSNLTLFGSSSMSFLTVPLFLDNRHNDVCWPW